MVQTPGRPPRLEIDGGIARITLRRPLQANRLGLDDMAVLHEHLEALRQSTAVRLLRLQGEGAHFCAGFQIDAVGEIDAPPLFEKLADSLESLPQLSLALIQGGCWGGAVDLALACDFRLGSPAARMGVPAARLGLHFYGNGMGRLVSRLGLQAAKRLLLAAESWEAPAMLERGFLDALDPDLEALAQHWQAQLTALAPLAQQGMKRHLNAIAAGRLDADQLQADMARCAASADLAEGVSAWLERRPPRFGGA